jgi:hypothetical protein
LRRLAGICGVLAWAVVLLARSGQWGWVRGWLFLDLMRDVVVLPHVDFA